MSLLGIDVGTTGCKAAVFSESGAVWGMGTYLCVTPVFEHRRDPALMIERGLNTEHHAVPGCYVSFLYNQGGALVKWFRDRFAAAERDQAARTGEDIYARLMSEMPSEPAGVLVLPHFTATGPPRFIADSSGVIAGLRLETSRGEILKAILEGTTFYLRECINALPPTGIDVSDFRAAGGGSKSDAWVQVCADILGRPFVRPKITEAGVLGAATIAGAGSGAFSSMAEGSEAMVILDRAFEPYPRRHLLYSVRFEHYRRLAALVEDSLRALAP